MIDDDRLQLHLEERARIASIEASPITSIVRRARQRDRRRRAAIGMFGVAAVGGLAVSAVWVAGPQDTEVRSVDSLSGTVETTTNASLPVDTSPIILPATTTAATGPGEQITGVAPSTTVAPGLPANGWVAQQFGNEIWLVRPGEEDRPVDFGGNAEACPAFSPDGKRLMSGVARYAAGFAFTDPALVVVEVADDGSTSHLTTIPLEGTDDIPCAIWAPDGRWAALGGNDAVFVVDTETAEVRRVADEAPGDLEWRPGTDELAITGRALPDRFVGANAPIAIYTVSTGETRTVGDVQANELTWSPDGATIAYTRAVPDATNVKSGITLIDADGTNERPLTTQSYETSQGIGVVWSPRGDEIAYQRERADCDPSRGCFEQSQIVLVTAYDTAPARPVGTERVIQPLPADISRREPWAAHSVTWSPDGTRLLYSAGIQGLVDVPVDATQAPNWLSSDGLTGNLDDETTSPWIPLQQWQPSR